MGAMVAHSPRRYRETLEIDHGSGDFEAYSSIEMRRVGPAE